MKSNRLVNDSDGVDPLTWTAAEIRHGKLVHIKKFPKGYQTTQLFLTKGLNAVFRMHDKTPIA